MKVLLIMGTFCKKATLQKLEPLLKKLGYTQISYICWTKNKALVDTFSYADILHWNIDKRDWDLIISHSAGGFPLSAMKGKRIALNPPPHLYIPIFRSGVKIIHGKDDWLMPPNVKGKNIFQYDGGHSDVSLELFEKVIKEMK